MYILWANCSDERFITHRGSADEAAVTWNDLHA